MKLYWTDTAADDLKNIQRYISFDKPDAGKQWIERLRNRARKACDSPMIGRIVPEFSREDIRELIEGNYRIVYQVFPEHLVVLTVFEGHKLLSTERIDIPS